MKDWNKPLALLNVAALLLVVSLGAARDERNPRVDSITVGHGRHNVVISADDDLSGIAIHREGRTIATLGLWHGEPVLRLNGGYAHVGGVTVTNEDSFGSVAIASNRFASGVWVQERPDRFAAFTAVKGIGPALELSSGRSRHEGDEFAVSFGEAGDVPKIQMFGRDGKLHFLESGRLADSTNPRPKPRTPRGDEPDVPRPSPQELPR